MILLGSLTVRAESPSPRPRCDDVLAACDRYVHALEAERTQLQLAVQEKDKRIVDLEASVRPTPWYWYAIGGVAAGFIIREVIGRE